MLSYETFTQLHDRLLKGATATQLEDAIPRFSRNLKIASAVSLAHWTDSTPFDDLAKAYILPEKVMDALGIGHSVTVGVVHVPAGLMHSYGYLFSQLKTAYGLKGKRWIESRLDERLGLKAGVFSPFTREGEFLSNVTAVLLEFIGAKASLPTAARLVPRTKSAGSVSEHVKWRTAEGVEKELTISTHLINLLALPGQETNDVKLLMYEVVDAKKHRLVTAFPVEQKFAEAIIGAKPESDTQFRPRFNLYIDPTWKVVAHRSEGFAAQAD
ncbi:MAG: hypothetical protein HY074_12065 [Deltaproteobacteria bacterium]|nr:hypothetical protein [Deltaproteobacteria bacterium]